MVIYENFKIIHMEETKIEPLCVRKKNALKEMRDIIMAAGPACVPRSYIARKYQVSWRSAESWYESLLNEIPLESLESLKKIGNKALSKSLELLEQMIQSRETTPTMRLKAIDTLNRTIQTNTEFMEKFNMKPIVAQEMNMAVNATLDVERIIQIAQDSDKPRPGEQKQIEAQVIPPNQAQEKVVKVIDIPKTTEVPQAVEANLQRDSASNAKSI